MKPTNKHFPLYCSESQTELYLEYIEVFFLLLSSEFHEEFACNGQHDQRQRKCQDGNESSIKDYQQADDTRWYIRQFGIHYSTGGKPLLVGFIDLDWASDFDD